MQGWRRITQVAALLGSNAYIKGFRDLTLYQGPLKSGCVPFLNCYACPGAVVSCPIGAMQTSLGSLNHSLPLYGIGVLATAGAIAGRLPCGWLCPFGMLQELLAKLSGVKLKIPGPITLLKYAVLVLTLLLPVLWLNAAGAGDPVFCKYLCPAGTLEAGWLFAAGKPELRTLLGPLFIWKSMALVAILLGAVFIHRPFCRVLCPLGAFLALFNKLSIYQITVDRRTCTQCGMCRTVCPVDIPVHIHPNSAECVRCLRCQSDCPNGSLSFGVREADTSWSDNMREESLR